MPSAQRNKALIQEILRHALRLQKDMSVSECSNRTATPALPEVFSVYDRIRTARRNSSGVRLSFTGKYDKDAQPLRDGLIDLEIGVIGTQAPEMKVQTLFRDAFVGICRTGHPLLAGSGVTAERYASYQHVVVSRKNNLYGPVDSALARQGLERQIMMVVPGFANAINIVRDSDLIGLIPLSALSCSPSLAEQRVTHFELPVVTPAISISSIWHPRLHADPEHRWLRETILSVCRRKFDALAL
ncbi:LysR substrate-binding domain-containing protein [Pantoea sp.]|uniref:LysR substrate-binding domain-containing protein n=1 Tax=Pantoea sp. TaxID=69393 RepID=UPI00289D5F8E|nr:LysR substrate-binding domain-containing protein [Pantoea sp.]